MMKHTNFQNIRKAIKQLNFNLTFYNILRKFRTMCVPQSLGKYTDILLIKRLLPITATFLTCVLANHSSAYPAFVSVPEDFKAEPNSIVFLEVHADSRIEVAYQWFNENGMMPYRTNSHFSFLIGNQSTNRFFYAVASDVDGSVTSRTIRVSVEVPPQSTALRILQQPQSVGVRPGNSASLTVDAQSLFPVSYQWFREGVALLGETNTSITVTNVQIENGAYERLYQVRVSDSEGSLMSDIATVTALEMPRFIEQPRTQYVIAGGVINLAVAASGTPPLGYRWRHKGMTIAHTGLPELVITNAQQSHAGRYDVIITNRANLAPGVLSQQTTVIVCDDLNQNLLPDCWETVVSLDPAKSGKSEDADGDSVSNYDEYLAGTNPMNPESVLRFSAIEAVSTNIVRLAFQASSNTSYTVQMQPAWLAPKWLRFTSHFSHTTNRDVVVLHTNTFSDTIFYRIITPRLE